MNVQRVKRLIHILKYIPKDHFDLGAFYEGVEIPDPTVDKIVHSCGATACALGYAALDPVFNAQGFKPEFFSSHTGPRGVRYGGVDSEYAAIEFFGLNHETTNQLFFVTDDPFDDDGDLLPEYQAFDEVADITPAATAAALQRLVDEYEAAAPNR